MHGRRILYLTLLGVLMLFFAVPGKSVEGQAFIVSTTTLTISICGDSIVNAGESCDVPGETGTYSTSITGRQCTTQCQYGPYCGDAILQTTFDEECDDGNNVSSDFCAADCTIENAGGGGGASSGSGGGAGGGSNEQLGDTQVSITGKAYPNATVNILEDGDVIGTVRANQSADFSFSGDVQPGTVSFGFWANDGKGVRSATLNTTFDVTEGAVTNINGIFLAPTISVSSPTTPKGGTATFSGRTVPNVDVKIQIDGTGAFQTVKSSLTGDWQLALPTASLSEAAHTAKAKFEFLAGGRLSESNFGQVLTFYVGVSPNAIISSSDLNSDGKINLTDFSILIFWWGGAGGNSNPPADINGNGKVGLEDFSILLFNWTG